MKYYCLKLLTQSGVKEVTYCDHHSLEDFIEVIKLKYGEFIQLNNDEFESEVYDVIYHLQENDETEWKPFLTTYYIFRKSHNLGFEVTHTAEGKMKTATFSSLNKLFRSVRVHFSNTEFE